MSQKTVSRVREAAKQLGYRGDRVAGALRRGVTGTIGVVVADLANPFIAPVIHGIAQAIAASHTLPMVIETNDDPSQLESGVDHLLSRRVDAVIVTAARFEDRPLLEKAGEHTPLVVAVRGLPDTTLPQVLHDDRAGGAMAAHHLIAQGHTRLTELRGPDDVGNFVARHEGFQAACLEAGVDVIQLSEFAPRPMREHGEYLARTLLELHHKNLPTAIFAHNDLMALGALSVLGEHEYSCPEDVSLVGYNDSPTIDQVNPPLTSVAYPGIEIGRAAGELALRLINDSQQPATGAVFPPRLCIRGSTGPPR